MRKPKSPPEHNTEGRRLLVELIDGGKWTQTAIASRVGLAQSSVSLWYAGRSRPETHVREQLEILLGIQRTAWDTADERARVESVRSSLATGTE